MTYEQLPTMLWTAAYSVAVLRQQVDSPNALTDRHMMYLGMLAEHEVAESVDTYLYGS